MGETRKLAAIIAVDVVGYSRLMGEDEAGTAKIVRERRERPRRSLRRIGGRVFKTMGDGILIEFPSVVAAVECALTMQKKRPSATRRLPRRKASSTALASISATCWSRARTMLATGSISRRGWKASRSREESAFPAPPSIMCAAGSTPEFIDLGERALKNIAQPVRVYALEVGEIARASASTPHEARRAGKAYQRRRCWGSRPCSS